MTPEERILAACIESGVDDLISPGILRNLVRSIEEACSAALLERDAAHETALKKARAEGLEQAARFCERLCGSNMDAYESDAPATGRWLAKEFRTMVRALLEEAGK